MCQTSPFRDGKINCCADIASDLLESARAFIAAAPPWDASRPPAWMVLEGPRPDKGPTNSRDNNSSACNCNNGITYRPPGVVSAPAATPTPAAVAETSRWIEEFNEMMCCLIYISVSCTILMIVSESLAGGPGLAVTVYMVLAILATLLLNFAIRSVHMWIA